MFLADAIVEKEGGKGGQKTDKREQTELMQICSYKSWQSVRQPVGPQFIGLVSAGTTQLKKKKNNSLELKTTDESRAAAPYCDPPGLCRV